MTGRRSAHTRAAAPWFLAVLALGSEQAPAPLVRYDVTLPAGPCQVFGAPEDHQVFRPIVPMNLGPWASPVRPLGPAEPGAAAACWAGPCPGATGAYAYGKPLTLMVATAGKAAPAALLETWTTLGVGNRERPGAVHYPNVEVTPGLFAGHGVVGTRFDLVLYLGPGTPEGPWLGEAAAAAMQTRNYHWSGGDTKWFLGASSRGLQERGAPGAGTLNRWNQAMGDAPLVKDRLHALLGYRSPCWDGWGHRVRTRLGGRSSCALPPEAQAEPAEAFLALNLRSAEERSALGGPQGIGATWLHAASLRFALTGACSESPAVYAWMAHQEGAPPFNYFDEAFQAPFPSPGRLGPGYALSLRGRYQTFGGPLPTGDANLQAAADRAVRNLDLPGGQLRLETTADERELFQDGTRRLVRRTFLYRRLVDGVPAYGPGTSVRVHVAATGAVEALDRDWAVLAAPLATAASLSHLDPAQWLAEALGEGMADAELHLEAGGVCYWAASTGPSEPLQLLPVMMVRATLRDPGGEACTEHLFYPVFGGP